MNVNLTNDNSISNNPNNFANPDYVHCSICNRRYNETAYGKHLPNCEKKQKLDLKKKKDNKNSNFKKR